MTRFALCAAAALAACSSEPRAGDAAPAALSTPVAGAVPAAPSPGAVADSRAVPQPGVLKTFGDWTVGCDNTRACEMRSLGTDLAPPEGATVAVARDAGPTGAATITLDGDDAGTSTFAVDGRAGGPTETLRAMANGTALTAKVGGRTVATASLRGASAALRYMDAVQGRAGTESALVARGTKLAGAVPAAASPPTIVAVAPGGQASKPTAAQIAAMRGSAGCDPVAGGSLGEPDAHALGGGRTLVLLPCSTGAYNLSSAVFVVDGGGYEPAEFDTPVGFDEADPPAPPPVVRTLPVRQVVNGDWSDGMLTSFAKGRGLGDCGVSQQFVWDGRRLRLARQSEMGECRGNANYITTWRATVVRR